MKCPFCEHEEFKVTDSRNALDANAIRRRRECLGCSRRFTTFETVELTIQVQKRDELYEDFLEEKLLSGIEAACRHTRISYAQVRALASKITTQLVERQVREITTNEIGGIVMENLKAMDTIAYVRFACVYRRFTDIKELMEAIQSINPKDSLEPIKS